MHSPRIRPPRLTSPTLLAALAACAAMLTGTTVSAQSSAASELWREWAVLEQQWQVERAEVKSDRRRLQARRDGRDPDADPKKTPAPAGRR